MTAKVVPGLTFQNLGRKICKHFFTVKIRKLSKMCLQVFTVFTCLLLSAYLFTMIFRTYFDKDTVISYESLANQGQDEILSLWYGGGRQNYSRYLFHFDEALLKSKYLSCELGDLSKVTHKLKWRYAGPQSDVECAPSSFELCLHQLNQPWAEGCGNARLLNDSQDCSVSITSSKSVASQAANWYFSETDVLWDVEGGVNTPPLDCKTFNCDSCDLEFDVTEAVNTIITGDTQTYYEVPVIVTTTGCTIQSSTTMVQNLNYGFALTFSNALEDNTGLLNVLNYFSRRTNTYYEPYLETNYHDSIKDNRTSFYVNELNRLYLYVGRGCETLALDENPTVKIYDHKNVLKYDLEATCFSKGVYYCEFMVSGDTYDKCGLWTDVWDDIVHNTQRLPSNRQKFQLLPTRDFYGYNHNVKNDYQLSFRGLKRGEKMIQGDIRRVFVDTRLIDRPHESFAADCLEYRIFIREGCCDEICVTEWIPLHQGVCENWFDIDTSWMIPQQYAIQLRSTLGGLVKTYPHEISFNVIQNTCKTC